MEVIYLTHYYIQIRMKDIYRIKDTDRANKLYYFAKITSFILNE